MLSSAVWAILIARRRGLSGGIVTGDGRKLRPQADGNAALNAEPGTRCRSFLPVADLTREVVELIAQAQQRLQHLRRLAVNR